MILHEDVSESIGPLSTGRAPVNRGPLANNLKAGMSPSRTTTRNNQTTTWPWVVHDHAMRCQICNQLKIQYDNTYLAQKYTACAFNDQLLQLSSRPHFVASAIPGQHDAHRPSSRPSNMPSCRMHQKKNRIHVTRNWASAAPDKIHSPKPLQQPHALPLKHACCLLGITSTPYTTHHHTHPCPVSLT